MAGSLFGFTKIHHVLSFSHVCPFFSWNLLNPCIESQPSIVLRPFRLFLLGLDSTWKIGSDPLGNIQTTMEHHHFYWENQL